MKSHLLFIAVLSCTMNSFSQINTHAPWVWMKGDNTIDQYGLYGEQTITHSQSKPGARNIASTWRDPAGNLWLLGGLGLGASQYGFLNDLWRFEPASNKWTWMKGDNEPDQLPVYGTTGTAATGNKPGGIYSGISWVDGSGKFWLFGGYGYGSDGVGLLNTLWSYDPVSNEWTWVMGDQEINSTGKYGTNGIAHAQNLPGARYCSVSWTDNNGDLWLFGGYGYGTSPDENGPLNDIWKFSVQTHEWTWIKGDSLIASKGHYGSKGISAPENNPGSRYISTSWKDAAGNIWVFGGQGYDENSMGMLNDLWKFNTGTQEWTWVSGDNAIDQPGHYGTRGVASNTAQPGARYIASSWADLGGDFWLFGGYGYDTTQTGFLNDLWRFSPQTGKWTWAKGDPVIDQPAIYGTQCLADSSNKSGSRMSSISWTDGVGNLWVFGGYGFDSTSSGSLNDLWKISSEQLILPVKLLDFHAVLKNEAADLFWETEYETGFSHYTIQRSFDGVRFTDLMTVNSNHAANRQHYTRTDYNLITQSWQKVFYRLQLTDINGERSYSRVVLLSHEPANSKMSIYPNPALQHINIQMSLPTADQLEGRIYNAGGILVQHFEKSVSTGTLSFSIDISRLPAGTYILLIKGKNLQSSQPFIKQ